MKRILAVVIALAMMLGCTLALAEEESGFKGLTIESRLSVNREVLKNALTALGTQEAVVGMADAVAAVLAEAGERVVVADGGAEFVLSLKDQDVLTLGGEFTDDGLAIASNLFPNTLLTLSYESIGQMAGKAVAEMIKDIKEDKARFESLEGVDFSAASQAFSTYFNEFVTACSNAMVTGEIETGEFELEGYSFNCRMPISMDTEALAAAMNDLIDKLNNDESVQAALQALQAAGVNISISDPVPVDQIPPIAIDVYMTLDENGEQTGATWVEVQVGEPEGATVVDTLVNGGEVHVAVSVVGREDGVAFSYVPDGDGKYMRLDVQAQGIYFGLDLTTHDDALGADFGMYLMDDENPLLTESIAIREGGERTLAIDAEGKKLLDMAALTGESGEELTESLAQDILIFGLGNVIGAASAAMPDEVGALMEIFQGSAE